VNGNSTRTTRQVAQNFFNGTSMSVCPATAQGDAYTIDANNRIAGLRASGAGKSCGAGGLRRP
jgi:hypothetical protein